MKPEEVQIKPGDPSGGVVYRTQSGQPSVASAAWFVPSDRSFQFDFVLSERGSGEVADATAGAQGPLDKARNQPDGHDPSRRLDFSSGNQGSEFAFNFAIPDVPLLPPDSAVPGSEAEAEAACRKPAMTPEESPILESETPGVAEDAHRIHEDCSVREAPAQAATQVGMGDSGSKFLFCILRYISAIQNVV